MDSVLEKIRQLVPISDEIKTLSDLVKVVFSDEDKLYELEQKGLSFSNDEVYRIFEVVSNLDNSYVEDNFYRYCFSNAEQVNKFIEDNVEIFISKIKENNVPYLLRNNDSIVKLILLEKKQDLITNIEEYSVDNLKLLADLMKTGLKVSERYGNVRLASKLFSIKDDLSEEEFSQLLNLLYDKKSYSRLDRKTGLNSFDVLVNDNIEYLIHVISSTGRVPKCLIESIPFRDECIKQNRIDLAVQCLLPDNILDNEELVNKYANTLGLSSKEFYERGKWVLDYYKRNNNIFNTLVATSLKNNIFNINSDHYDRFINDIDMQIRIGLLNDKELEVLNKILDAYDYEEYDISLMIIKIIDNIKDYKELINNIDVNSLNIDSIKQLVRVLELPNNQFNINTLEDLNNYNNKKKEYFVNNSNKNSLIKMLFNIDLKEAEYINYKYCYDNYNNNMLESIKESELPKEVYKYLELINHIVELDNIEDLDLDNITIYNGDINLEAYLRSAYTKLYSDTLFKIDKRKQIFGPQEDMFDNVEYNGMNIEVCVPRESFRFFVHCVGSCSLKEDAIDSNYKVDWMDRPQMQDHFVACSYLSEKGIHSIRSNGSIIMGFDTLENGSILAMGNTDIDSIGWYSKSYNGARVVQEGNGNRAKFYTPKEMLKTIQGGYNEIVVERRNTNKDKEEYKRKPDYIIMMADSLDKTNFMFLDSLFNNELQFIEDNDKEIIRRLNNKNEINKFLTKYNEIIEVRALTEEISVKDLRNYYTDLIINAKYYEDCLKASSEFDIPLVVVDKAYYFNKLLSESSAYDDDTKERLREIYNSDKNKRSMLFNMVAKGGSVENVLNPPKQNISISLW